MPNKLATPEDFARYEHAQAKQTIEQLRANAKGHKKTVDKLAAKVSQLTQENAELRSKQKTKWSTLVMAAASCLLFGFLATVGGICAYGWAIAMGRLL
jgi:cell division septum initiation protein DivIVA